MSLKARIEAALFLTDKPIPALAIAQLVNADVQIVRQTILELIHDYEERDSALEIADDNGYMMQVKDDFATIANDIAPIDLPVSVVRTLSAIAIKQPLLQSELVRIRGAGAYDHVKELLEKELITKKEEGRSSLLSTTKKFQEYFRLSQDAKALRVQLKEQTDKTESGETAEQLALPIGAEQSLAELSLTEQTIENSQLLEQTEPAAESFAVDDATTVDNAAAEDTEETSSTNSGNQDNFIEPQINALASSNI